MSDALSSKKIGEGWLLERSESDSQHEAECEAATQRCMMLTKHWKLMKIAKVVGNQ
jgi:hypothetical protein